MTVWNSSNNIGGTVHIHGLADLQRTLDQIPAKIEANVLRGALRAGANVIADEARRLVPVKTGQLKESIRVSVRPFPGGKLVATVKAGGRFKVYAAGKAIKGASYKTTGASGKPDYHAPFYAHFVEFGTARHWIKPKSRKSLFIAGLLKELVDHPGGRAKPFMRPAFDGKARAAIEAMAAYIRTRLPKEFKRLGTGYQEARNGLR
jgi:HK97 gp10 family phage protein